MYNCSSPCTKIKNLAGFLRQHTNLFYNKSNLNIGNLDKRKCQHLQGPFYIFSVFNNSENVLNLDYKRLFCGIKMIIYYMTVAATFTIQSLYFEMSK